MMLCLGAIVVLGILKHRQMQMDYDLRCPTKDEK